MSTDSYRPASVRAIIFGIIAFIILLTIICGLSEVIKGIGAPFMVLPEAIGWIPDADRKDVVTIDMQMASIQTTFDQTGNYTIYGYDYDLLLITDEMARSTGNPWLKIQNIANSEEITPEFISRPLIPFDSILVRGRPLFNFYISQPGDYQLVFPRRFATIFLLPDQVTGHLGIILFSFFAQLIIISIPIITIFRNIYLKKQVKLNEIRNLKRTSNEQFWQELDRKRDSNKGL
jgi:hypothetical protein